MHLRAWLGAFRGFRASGLRVEGILCSVNGLLVYRASGHDDDDDDKINDDTGDDEGQEEEEDDDTHSNDGDADDGNDET